MKEFYNTLVEETINLQVRMNANVYYQNETAEMGEPLDLRSTHDMPAMPANLGLEVSQKLPLIPETCGLIYAIQAGEHTFSVKTFPVRNLKVGMEELSTNAHTIEGKITYFTTEYYELAGMIAEAIGKKRFPIRPAEVYNLGDLSSNWWLSYSENEFKLFFRVPNENSQSLVKLGPMGNIGLAGKKFKEIIPYLQNLFPIINFGVNERSISFSLKEGRNDYLQEFINIFLHGERPALLLEFLKEEEARSLYYYFIELAAIRSFWIRVEAEVNAKKGDESLEHSEFFCQ
jgi:hypothetical protein